MHKSHWIYNIHPTKLKCVPRSVVQIEIRCTAIMCMTVVLQEGHFYGHHWTLSYAVVNLHWYRMSLREPTRVYLCLVGQHWPIAQKLINANFHLIQFFSSSSSFSSPSSSPRLRSFPNNNFFQIIWVYVIVCGIHCHCPLKSRSISSTRTVSSARFMHTILTVTDLFLCFFFVFIHSLRFIHSAIELVSGKADVVGTMPLVPMVKRVSRASRQLRGNWSITFAASITTGS